MNVRILLIPKRENPPTIKANKASSTGEPVAHFLRTHVASIPEKVSEVRTRKLVAVTLITELKVYFVQKEDSNRKEIVKRLIQQFENHPNSDSSIQDLKKTEGFNPFSEKSKELVDHQHG